MRIIVVLILQIRVKTDRRLFVQPFLDNIFQIRKRAAADKKNVSCVHCHQRHHSVFAVGPYRNLYLASLQKLQHSLLHSLAAYVSLIGVFLLGDLIDLVNENDPVFRFFNIVVRGCQKL